MFKKVTTILGNINYYTTLRKVKSIIYGVE